MKIHYLDDDEIALLKQAGKKLAEYQLTVDVYKRQVCNCSNNNSPSFSFCTSSLICSVWKYRTAGGKPDLQGGVSMLILDFFHSIRTFYAWVFPLNMRNSQLHHRSGGTKISSHRWKARQIHICNKRPESGQNTQHYK